MLIHSGTVSVSGTVPGFPSLLVDNSGSYAARKILFHSIINNFTDLKICDSELSCLPVQTALLKFSLDMKSLFVKRISNFLLHIL